MNYEKFTAKTKEALNAAQLSAQASGNPELTPEHVLHEIFKQDGGMGEMLLARMGIDLRPLTGLLDTHLKKLPRAEGGDTRPGQKLARVFKDAETLAAEQGDA